jgi:alkylhydroperoxidase family enzyme
VVYERGHAGDAAVDAFLAAGFTRRNVLEVVTIIATKTISNYTNHLTRTPKESFMSDPALKWVAAGNRSGA